MKKISIVLSAFLIAAKIFAQGGGIPETITPRNGGMLLPEAGDWAICMDATPWLNYFGNFFSGAGNKAPTINFLNSTQTIVCKYYVSENTAYRILAGIGFNATTQSKEIPSDDSGQTYPATQVEDEKMVVSHFIGLGAGIEKRIGATRLQGYYGMEFMFYNSGADTSYQYGNAFKYFTDEHPSWYNWNSGNIVAGLPRETQNTLGSTFGMMIAGYIGFEYFFLPKISIGGEFTWGITFHSTNEGSYQLEALSPNGTHQYDTYFYGGSSGISLDNGLNQGFGSGSGSLYINFHF